MRILGSSSTRALGFLLLAIAVGCGGDDNNNNGGGSTPDGSVGDAAHDAGRRDSAAPTPHDSGSLFGDTGSPDVDANMPPDVDANMPDMDAGVDANPPVDANTPPDANVPVDGNLPVDANVPVDANTPVDANLPVDAGVDCGSVPTLHPTDGGAGSLFCPFGPDGGAPLHCDSPTEECCIGGSLDAGGFASSVCQAMDTACTNGNSPPRVECESPNNCGAGDVCCLVGTPTQDLACSDWYGVGVTGTNCEHGTSCAAGEFQVCETLSDCTAPGATMCTPMKTKGVQIGFCQ
jgi:hypothetical protein